jgi:hypothetical protein
VGVKFAECGATGLIFVFIHAREGNGNCALWPIVQKILDELTALTARRIRSVELYFDRLATKNEKDIWMIKVNLAPSISTTL